MRLLKRYLPGMAAALLLLSAPANAAQVFGIDKGTPVSDVNVIKDLGEGYYIIEVPKTVSFFETYVTFATENTGVCMLRGLGKDHERDGYGIDVREDFDKIRSALDKKYGKSELYSGLRSGAIWDEVDEWVMAIRQNERYHQAAWEPEDVEGIVDILLDVNATSSNDSYISLQYRFDNIDSCLADIENEDSSGL